MVNAKIISALTDNERWSAAIILKLDPDGPR
jgi:hypothetical protein